MKKLFLLFTILCSITVAQAQVISAYTMQAAQGSYTEITDGTVMDMTGLDLSVEAPLSGKAWYPSGIVAEETTAAGFPIGFDFTFNDIECNQFIIGAHGYIALGRDEINIDPSHNQHIIIRETAADNIIGIMPNVWDIYLNESSEFSYKVIGEAPNRTLVVQFKNWTPCFGWDAEAAVSMNMQLRLNETSNTIEFVLGDITSGGDYTANTRFALRGYYDDVISLTYGEEEGMLNWVAVAGDNQPYFGKDLVTSGITFTFTPPADCVAPVEDFIFTDLIPTSNSFSMQWEKVTDADHVLLLLSDTYVLTQEPVNGMIYHENDSLGNALVLAYTTDTIYEPWELELKPSTQYYIHIYSANSYCSNGPVYGTTNAVLASFSTKPAAPANIEITETSLNTLTFDVETNGTDDVLVILTDSVSPNPPYANIIEFGNPIGAYEVGEIIDGTGLVVYIGPSAENIVAEGLEAGTAYYLRAHSYNEGIGYSTEVVETADVTVATLPWTVDLSNTDKQTVPVGWTSEGTNQNLLASSQQSGYGEESMQFYVQIQPNTTDGHMIELTSPQILVDKENALLSLEYNMHIWQRFGGNIKYDEWDERDTFAIQVSRNGGEFETLTELNYTNNAKVDTVVEFIPVSADLSGYYNDIVQVRIYWNCYSNQKVRLTLEKLNIDAVVIPEVTVKEITATSAKVEWSGAQENYEVAYAKTDEEFNTIVVEGAKALELNDLEVETEYQVKVRGIVDEDEYSYWSEVVTFKTTPMPECDAPTNLNADLTTFAEDQSVTLSWEGTEEHLTWEVRYRDGNSTSWITIENLEEPTVVIENLEGGLTYLWNVRAYCTADRVTSWSAQSSFVTPELTLDAPTNVTADGISTSEIYLTWNAVEGAEEYGLYYQGEQFGSVPAEYTAVTVQGLAYNTEYCFQITAIKGDLESDKSEEKCATTLGESIAENANEFNIYPNPVSNNLYIETEANVVEVVVYDVYGRKLSAVSCQQSVVDVTELNSGIYFVKVVTDNGETVKRFVKK